MLTVAQKLFSRERATHTLSYSFIIPLYRKNVKGWIEKRDRGRRRKKTVDAVLSCSPLLERDARAPDARRDGVRPRAVVVGGW